MAEETDIAASVLPTESAAPASKRRVTINVRESVVAFAHSGTLVLIAIVALAGLLRLWDVNWDQNTHVHPDERFLTMVGTALQIPSSIGQYLDPATSPLNPANAGCTNGQCPYTFYVYGILPVTLNKLLAVVLHNDTYDNFALQGRVLSAIADILLLLVLYWIVLLLERERGLRPQIKYIAVFCYAISVLPIQLAHFFTVDSFLNLFMVASFFFALRYALKGGWINVVCSAVCFGLAVACKTSAVFILPLNVYFVLVRLFPQTGGDLSAVAASLWSAVRDRRRLTHLLVRAVELGLVYALASYLALRIADPYYFQSPNLLDPRLSQLLLHNLATLRAEDTPSIWFPPSVQWIHKLPVLFALTNLVFFGLGLPLFLVAVAGGYVVSSEKWRRELFVILLWVVLFSLFQSVQYAKTMRYFIFIYPFLAIFAAIGLETLTRGWGLRLRVPVALTLLIWPAAFMSIYMHDHSRVQASAWMFRTLPNGSYIVSEEWDDALPLPAGETYGKAFTGAQIPSFAPDLITDASGNRILNADKWKKITSEFKRADYLVLSSNRGWGSIPTVPEEYPRMTRFYKDLFAGKTAFKHVATFTSYPSLRYLGIPIDFPDQWSEEAFTVYDHPQVDIFEHVR